MPKINTNLGHKQVIFTGRRQIGIEIQRMEQILDEKKSIIFGIPTIHFFD